jgi:hypothetical protein
MSANMSTISTHPRNVSIFWIKIDISRTGMLLTLSGVLVRVLKLHTSVPEGITRSPSEPGVRKPAPVSALAAANPHARNHKPRPAPASAAPVRDETFEMGCKRGQ